MTLAHDFVPFDESLPAEAFDCSCEHYPDSWLERAELENVFLRAEVRAAPGAALVATPTALALVPAGPTSALALVPANGTRALLRLSDIAPGWSLRPGVARPAADVDPPTQAGSVADREASAPATDGAPRIADRPVEVEDASATATVADPLAGAPEEVEEDVDGALPSAVPVEPAVEAVAVGTGTTPAAALVQLADAAGAGFVRVDLEGIAWALNPGGALLLEAIGASDGAEAPGELRAALAASALDGFPITRDIAAQTPESRHISLTALVYGEEQLVSLRDYTEERLLQERLLQSEKMASVGQLVSGVAHELNNPLTAVTGFAQILLGRQDLDITVRSHLRKIYEEGERAAKIVQNLLSFARRRKPAKEMTDINVLVERVLELRSYDFGMRNMTLDMTLDRRMPKVWVDPDQIQQVLFNLVKNAEQAMADAHGGGQLTVLSASTADGTGVRISVGDSGPGIPLDVQRRIFDPFFTTKEAGQGTGLGLTISYSIIDEHGGRIWAENGASGGAVFTIELPLDVPSQVAHSPGRPVEGAFLEPLTRRTAGKRILVADDEESIRLLLNDVLEMDGHSVATASTGIEAMQILLSGGVDLIISDMKMPGMDGATLFRELRSIDPGLAQRLIFMTGDTVSADTRSFLQGVTNPVIAKPFRIAALREAIEKILGT